MQTLRTRLLQRGWSVFLLFSIAFPVLLGTRGLPVPWTHLGMMPYEKIFGISILQKYKQRLWSMLLQSSQNLLASKFSPANDTDPTSRGQNPSAKPLENWGGGKRELRTFLSPDKKWGWHKGHVAYKGTLGEISIEAGLQGSCLRPVYINFSVWLINYIIFHYVLFLSDSVDERSRLDSKCLDTQSKCRNSIVNLLFNSSALEQDQLEAQWS